MRLVTWNIRSGRGMDNRRSLRRILDVLRRIDADVVCLQEVERRLPTSSFRDQPAWLASHLGMDHRFQANLTLGPGGFGNAVLSRLPILATEQVPLPNERERRDILRLPERRGYLKVTVGGADGEVDVICTHLSLHAEDRRESVDRLVGGIRRSVNPVVLCGDLNAQPDSDEITELAGGASLCETGRELTYPADKPVWRIDYIWTREPLAIQRLEVISTLASDHLPVVAELEYST